VIGFMQGGVLALCVCVCGILKGQSLNFVGHDDVCLGELKLTWQRVVYCLAKGDLAGWLLLLLWVQAAM